MEGGADPIDEVDPERLVALHRDQLAPHDQPRDALPLGEASQGDDVRSVRAHPRVGLDGIERPAPAPRRGPGEPEDRHDRDPQPFGASLADRTKERRGRGGARSRTRVVGEAMRLRPLDRHEDVGEPARGDLLDHDAVVVVEIAGEEAERRAADPGVGGRDRVT